MGDRGRVFSTRGPQGSGPQNHLAESMIDHLTVRPINLTNADLKAFLDGQRQRHLNDFEEPTDDTQ